jgi:PAS domain S-box-containing protein
MSSSPSPFSSASHGSFEALAESAPDAILVIDEDSVILSANPATERVFGYAPDELVGRQLSVLIPERLRAAHHRGITRYLRSGRRNIPWTGVELPGLHKDGREFPVEVSFGEFIDDTGRRVFSGFMRDISERVRHLLEIHRANAEAERALRELDRVARIIDTPLAMGTFDSMLNSLLTTLREETDADAAAVLLLNEEKESLSIRAHVGLEVNEATSNVPFGAGVSGRVAMTGRPMVVEDTHAAGIQALALGIEIRSAAAVPLRSDDDLIGVLIVGASEAHRFGDADLRLLQLVSERLRGVFARTRLFAELERHTNEERALRALAEAAVQAREDVLAIVSHDLRNPLSTIAMAASLLTESGLTLTAEQQRRQLDVIARTAKRMNRLIQDLLDVARIEGGRFTVSRRRQRAAPLATEAKEAYRPIAQESDVELTCDVEEGLPEVYVDRDRVMQLLGNYVGNAIKFTPPGGRVVIRARRSESNGVRFSVTDNGPGIPAADLPNVFSRFWQAKNTAHLGSGLGLAIAHGIAKAHDGRVWVESSPGKETTFYFEIPVESRR